jgi:Protein of unknown function (DUF1441)
MLWLHCNRSKLSEKIKASGLRTVGKSANGYPTYRMHDVFELLLTETLNASGHGEDPSQWSPKDRLDHYKAENERLKLEAAQGRLAPLEDVGNTVSTSYKAIVLMLETLPDRVELDAGLGASQVGAMQRCIDGQREQLYQSLVAPFDT